MVINKCCDFRGAEIAVPFGLTACAVPCIPGDGPCSLCYCDCLFQVLRLLHISRGHSVASDEQQDAAV
jgi:hypothetical protein